MENLLLGNIPSPNKLILELPNFAAIDHIDRKFVTFGSCFASSVSRGLWRLGFDTYFSEDMGFHYSPNSIAQFLQQIDYSPAALEQLTIPLEDGRYKSIATRYLSELGQSVSQFCEFLHQQNQQLKTRLLAADFVIVTLGNATYQRLVSNGAVLCHGGGLPAELYEVVKTSYNEVRQHTLECIRQIRQLNAHCQIIMTVSPQRYGWLMNANLATGINEILDLDKDAATNWLLNSNLDKAKLRLAIDELLTDGSVKQLYYFPAYEIVMDELRDYEGFNHDVKDLMHVNMPNTPNYVINKFLNAFCTAELKAALAFYRSTLDILIDGYPGRLKKMSLQKAEAYTTEKLLLVHQYLHAVAARKLAGYVINGMLQVFPAIVKKVIATHQLTGLESFINDTTESRISAISRLGDEAICVIGYSSDLDSLCRNSHLLTKNIRRIIAPALQSDSLFGIPVHRELTELQLGESTLLVLEQDLLTHPAIAEQLHDKVLI